MVTNPPKKNASGDQTCHRKCENGWKWKVWWETPWENGHNTWKNTNSSKSPNRWFSIKPVVSWRSQGLQGLLRCKPLWARLGGAFSKKTYRPRITIYRYKIKCTCAIMCTFVIICHLSISLLFPVQFVASWLVFAQVFSLEPCSANLVELSNKARRKGKWDYPQIRPQNISGGQAIMWHKSRHGQGTQ